MSMVNTTTHTTHTTRGIISDAQYADLRAKIDKQNAWVDGLRKRSKCRACKGTGKRNRMPNNTRICEECTDQQEQWCKHGLQIGCAKCDGKGYTLGNACYKVEDMPVDVPNVSNEERSLVEVYEFVRDKPQRYFAYVKDGPNVGQWYGYWLITTFVGDMLGHVTWRGDEYKVHGIGQPSTRQNLRVVGVNGVVYSAVYYKSSGDYCRMKAFKNADKRVEVSK